MCRLMGNVALLMVLLSMFVPAASFAQTNPEKETIQREVTAQFNQLICAINQKNAVAWSDYYSKDEFVSAIAGTGFYANRSAWVGEITKYFSMRERQQVEPFEVRVTPLAADLALLTSEERAEMQVKNGESIKSKHVFSMIWKKEPGGWKVLHSHESWMDYDQQKTGK